MVLDRLSRHNLGRHSHETILYHRAAARGVSRAGGKGEREEGKGGILVLMGVA